MVTRIAALLIFTFATALHLGAQVRVTTTDLLYIKQRMQIGTDTSLNFTSIVDTITAASTHHQAPSALAVYEAIGEYGGGGGGGGGHVILEGDTPRAQKDSLEFQSNSSIIFGATNTSTRTVVDATLESNSVGSAEIAADAVGSSELASTAVTPGAYTAADITVDADGRITAAANGTVDASATNEGSLTVGAGTGSTSLISSNTSGSTDVTITAGTGISVAETGNNITLTNTGDTNAADDITGTLSAGQVPYASGAQTVTGSDNLWYSGPTLTLNSSTDDTLLMLTRNHGSPFGIYQFTDPYNGSTVAYRLGGLNGRRIFLEGYGLYPEAPFYQEETAGIGFAGTTGTLRLHTNGDYYTATLTGDNSAANRNVTYYFESGGATTGVGNPVIFQNIFSANDSTANGFEFISRNTHAGGVTIADSALFRITSWDKGIGFNLTQAGDLGLKLRQPLYSLDINDTDGIRIPRGTTAQRPAGTPAGVVRFNTDSTAVEVGTGSAWTTLGGGGGVTDHGALTGLSDDDHTQYALLAGRSGGQAITGGTASGDDLTLRSTTNATKGDIIVADQGGNVVVGGGATASEIRILEPSGDGSNYTAIKAQAQGADITYTLPASSTDGYMKNTSGTLSWGMPGDILNGGNTTGATLVVGTNDAQSLELETNGTTFMTANSSGNIGLGSAPGGMRLAVNLTDASTSGTPIGLQSKLILSPAGNSSASTRSLNMANQFDASGINFTGNPQAGWFENRVIHAGDFSGNLYGIYSSGLLMGGDAATIGTVTNTAAIHLIPVTSFSNSISGTVTKCIGALVANAAKGSLTVTNQVGINVSALSSGTNNTSILLGTNTAPSGNFGIYSTITDDSYHAGQLGLGVTGPTAVLHLKAGTASANTGPLKFTSGTNLTTAEAGTIEYDGTELYFSPSTTRQKIVRSLNGSASLNFGSTTTGTSADLTITVTGAADGDPVILGVPNAAVNANSCYTAWVSATNTVTVRFNNYSTGSIDPASATFKVTVQK